MAPAPICTPNIGQRLSVMQSAGAALRRRAIVHPAAPARAGARRIRLLRPGPRSAPEPCMSMPSALRMQSRSASVLASDEPARHALYSIRALRSDLAEGFASPLKCLCVHPQQRLQHWGPQAERLRGAHEVACNPESMAHGRGHLGGQERP